MSFDLEAALPASKGWSAIQIATPVIVAVIILVLASIAFFLYRRYKQQGSILYKQPRKAWEDAKLHGPRRFFGLLPETLKVKPRRARDERWEIDDNKVLDEPSPPLETASTHQRAFTPSMHTRSASAMSLLSSHSPSTSSRSGGIFSAIASKFSLPSLSRTYQSGTSKGPDYKRVQVHPGQPDRQVGIDGAALSPRDARPSTSSGRWSPPASQSPPQIIHSASTPTPAAEPASRESTMPSVFDIRGPGARSAVMSAGARTGTGTGTGPSSYGHRSYLNSDLLVPDDDTTDFMSNAVPHSEYSLRSSDLQTPVTPTRDTAAALMSVSSYLDSMPEY
ncbi:hypothetical protein EIP86_001654 [Pleurotus ostreatoroseus]|nr:hypothetical protein EIP86_001654 [Pleurotus ostreatoroseus]